MLHLKKIFIWGFAKVGKSFLKFLSQSSFINTHQITIIDQKELSKEEITIIKKKNVQFILEKSISSQLLSSSWILPSPGVDIKKYYPKYKKYFISELDLFYSNFIKPVIAITGSVGKTSITTICASILQANNISCFVGGNIGTPMLDIINKQSDTTCALLEVSSFQLEYTCLFAPDIAVLTNIYPNHFDRHENLTNYINAKLHIFMYQNKNQYAIMALSLRSMALHTIPLHQKCIFFSQRPPTEQEKNTIKNIDAIIFSNENKIYLYQNNIIRILTTIPEEPVHFFAQNWLVVCAILYAAQIDCATIHLQALCLAEHRLEHIATHATVSFYNDSKSTTPSSTKAAITQFTNKQVHLFLGGLSKGLDRAPLIASCKNKKIYIHCFGKDSDQLAQLCAKYGITYSCHATLESAFEYCTQRTRTNDIVLFSPSGSSFDLYKNYQERGTHFKTLVQTYITKQTMYAKK